MQEILTPKNSPTPSGNGRRAGLWIAGVTTLVVAGLTLAALLVTGVVGGPSPAERQAQALARSQAELRPELEEFMQLRASFFAAERRYLPAMEGTRAAIGKYNRRLAKVEAEIDEINLSGSRGDRDYPDYPRLPRLGPERRDLKAVVQRTGELHARLSDLRGTGALAMSYSELLGAVDLLGQDASDSLSALEEMLNRPKGEGLYASGAARLRIRTLSGNSALPVVRRMNGNLVRLLERHRLTVEGYDLPGGRDKFRGDHSMSV